MRNYSTFYFLFFLLNNIVLYAQSNCELLTKQYYQSANRNPTSVGNGGEIFKYLEESNSYALYSVNSLLYSSGLWVVGKDSKSGKIKAAASQYRRISDNDYWSGMINDQGQNVLEKEFNRVWGVSRLDIEQHLADYADNKKIDNPNLAVFSWPAKGNPFFFAYSGFVLPTKDFAPFYDTNNDGIYSPEKGDFPLPEGINKNSIPELTTWTLFNDNCLHTMSNTEPIGLEFHQTTWAFNCSNSEIINNTNFVSYKIQNKGNTTLDSTSIGFWGDADIGCYSDDYMGCNPSKNTIFAYNADEIDGEMLQTGVSVCGGNPMPTGSIPVIAITSLNQKLDGFMMSSNGSLGPIPPATIDPDQGLDFFRYLNSQWRDGTPLTHKELGYNPGENLPIQRYAFPGDPNDSLQFSMKSTKVSLLKRDFRMIGSYRIGKILPNQSFKVDFAYSLNHKKDNTVSKDLDLMKLNIDSIQSLYNNGFVFSCSKIEYCKGKDCVYPGDANQDGTVNYKDMVLNANNYAETGSVRNEPFIFAPLNSKDWVKSVENINQKHLDFDGNGKTTKFDIELATNFYDFKAPFFTKQVDVIPKIGKDLFFTVRDFQAQTLSLPENLPLGSPLELTLTLSVNGVQSIGFQLEIDSNYIDPERLFRYSNSSSSLKMTNVKAEGDKFIIDFMVTTYNKNTFSNALDIGFLKFIGRQTKPIFASKCTKVKIKNVIAYANNKTKVEIATEEFDLCFKGIVVDLEELNESNYINITPNPFLNNLNFDSVNSDRAEITIFDTSGKTVFHEWLEANENKKIQTESFVNGVYFIQCKTSKSNKIKKFVKN